MSAAARIWSELCFARIYGAEPSTFRSGLNSSAAWHFRCSFRGMTLKNLIRYFCGAIVFASIVLYPGCSTGQQSPIQLSNNGPTVVGARSVPGVVVLNRNLQPQQPAEVLADVKDFKSNILDVRLKFNDVPMDIP